MDRYLALWALLYGPALGITGFGVAMSRLPFWGLRGARIATYVAFSIFVLSGVGWALTTNYPAWVRVLNGILEAAVAAIVFPAIFAALCDSTDAPTTASDSS
jgi:hypothetical protein